MPKNEQTKQPESYNLTALDKWLAEYETWYNRQAEQNTTAESNPNDPPPPPPGPIKP